MTRTEVILAAVKRSLQERQVMLDKASDVGEITITVKLQAGTSTVRQVVWQDVRVVPRV